MSELGDLTIRLAMESGSVSSQIKRLKGEMQTLESGFQAAASQAGGFGTAMDAAAARAQMLQGKLNAQNAIVETQKRAWDMAKQSLEKAKANYEATGQALEQQRQKAADLQGEIERLKAAMAEEAAANGESSESYQEMAQRLASLQQEYAQTGQEIERLEKVQTRQGQAVANAVQAVQRAETAYNQARTAANGLEREVEAANRRLQRHVQMLESAGKGLTKFGEGAQKVGKAEEKLGKTLTKTVTAPIVAAGTAAVNAAISWEDSFAGVRRVVSGTGEQLDALGDSLLEMSKTGPTAAGELASIAQSAGQLGIARENIVGFTDTIAKMAATSDLSSDEAATAFAQYMNITGLTQDQVDRLGSMTLALGSSLATTESEVVGFATAIAAAGKQAKMTDQEIFGISGALASLGLSSQAGGTAFSKLIANMQVASETGGKELKQFADIAGMSAKDFAKAFKEDAAGAFQKFLTGLTKDSNKQSAIAMLDEIGIKEARMRDMILRASGAQDLMNQSMETANQAFAENTALTKAAEIKYGTTANKLKALGNQATAVGISFGESMLPSLQQGMDFISTLIEKFGALDDETRKTIVQWGLFAAALGPGLTIVGKLTTGIGAASQALGSFMTACAAGGGGLAGFGSALAGIMGPAGLLAAGAAALYFGGQLLDVATGAKAAKEAIAELQKQSEDWAAVAAETIFKEDLVGGIKNLSKGGGDGGDWLEGVKKEWTDGKKETDEIVKQWADGFKSATDEARTKISGAESVMEGYKIMTPEKKAEMDADLQTLDALDTQVADLLGKRKNKKLTPDDEKQLEEALKKRQEILDKYDKDAIVKEGAGSALTEGLKDGGEYAQQLQQLDKVLAELGKGSDLDLTQLADLTAGLDEGSLASMIGLIEQLKEAGTTDAEFSDMGLENVDMLYDKLEQIRDLSGQIEGAENLRSLFEAGLAGEVIKISTDLDMEPARKTWTAFASGGGLEPVSTQMTITGVTGANGKTYEVTDAQVTVTGTLGQVTGKDGYVYDVVSAEVRADGTLKSVTGADGVTYQVLGATVTADGTLYTVRGEDGKTYTVSGADVKVDGTLGAVAGEDGREYKVTGATVKADGTLSAVTAENGRTYAVSDADVQVSGKLAGLTVQALISNIDKAQVDAWNAANKDVGLKTDPVKVGVSLGDNWAGEIQQALSEGRAQIYGVDGVEVPVMPGEVKEKLGPNDLVLGTDENGVLHIQIQAAPGEEKIDLTGGMMKEEAGQGILAGLTASASDSVQQISALASEVERFRQAAEEAKAADDSWGESLNMEAANANLEAMNNELSSLTDDDLENIGAHMGALVEAINSGAGTEEQLAAWREELQGLQDFVNAVPEGSFNEIGTDISEGIGQGMATYSFGTDAASVAAAVDAALRGATGANSPATLSVPIGSDIGEGIGKGMQDYSLDAACAAIAAKVSNGLSGMAADGIRIGKAFDNGLAAGITSGKSKVVEAAKKAAEAAVKAAKDALDINSPSRVGKALGGSYTEGIALGIQKGQRDLAAATEAALKPLTAADGPLSMRMREAGYLDGQGQRATQAALESLSRDVRRAGREAAQSPGIDIEALADANARRPVVLQVGERQLARSTAAATHDAQREYDRRVAFAYGGK